MYSRTLLVGLVALGTAACSAGTFPFADGGAGDGAAGDSSTSDGGTGSDGGTTATKGGGIYLTGWDYVVQSTPVQGGSASASFVSAYPTGGSACTTTTSGSCTITQCPLGGASDAGTPPAVSAGTIDVTGASKSIQLVPSGTTYGAQTSQTKLWNGGETLEAISSGGTVPAFDLTVTAPGYVTVTAPAFPAPGGKVSVYRTQPLAVAWSGGSAGQVNVGITGTTASSSTSIACVYPAANGSASVPASVLGNLPSSATSASIAITSMSVSEKVISGYAIRFQVMSLSKTSTGTASAQATIL